MVLFHVLAALLPFQLPASGLEKAADEPSVWVPATHVIDLKKVPGS